MGISSHIKTLKDNSNFYQHFRSLRKRFRDYRESRLDDEAFFVKRHKKIFGYKPDFKKPQTFNEKIIHRILYDRNPIYTALADKLKARIYIAHTLGFLPLDLITDKKVAGGGAYLKARK